MRRAVKDRFVELLNSKVKYGNGERECAYSAAWLLCMSTQATRLKVQGMDAVTPLPLSNGCLNNFRILTKR